MDPYLEKAFDRVDWVFLKNIMCCKNFDDHWISWIMGCIKNPRFLVFINRRPRGRIFASRGIRQGDPLSPFLFLLISEILGGNVLFEGFVVGKERTHVSILQFTDDTLLSCKYDDGMLDKLRQTLELFEWCSGQKINWEKSALYGVNIDDNKLLSTASRVKCKVETSVTYLGLPLGGYPKKVSFWQPMIDKIHAKLDKWRRFNLSRGGRATLCKPVLSNLPPSNT